MNATGQGKDLQDKKRPNTETLLAYYDPYIMAQVKERMCQYPAIFRPAVLDLEIDELAQLVRIKLWRALEEKEIQYPKSYIQRIVNNEFISMLRRRKPVQPLSEDKEGEIFHGEVLVTPGEIMHDPAEVIAQQEAITSCMQEIAAAVLQLPQRQQHAMVCSLRDRVDDLLLLVDGFQKYRVDIGQWQWPQKAKEKQLLQASLSYARQNITRYVKSTFSARGSYLRRKKKSVRILQT